jgi:Fe-S-cluster-containing hydrogenase component 2/CRP-like cAMP-binding protein
MADSTDSRTDFSAILTSGMVPPENEGMFGRDIDGRLIRVVKATAADFAEMVNLSIDGRELQVHKAVPTRDSQGNIIRGDDGQPVPRFTTIYDAASQAFVQHPGDRNPIPTMCHKEHLPPVGVCRVCLVELVETSSRGTRKKLVPSCMQRVAEGMVVHTVASQTDQGAAARVKTATSVIAELLATDHLPADEDGRFLTHESAGAGNELAALAERLEVTESRFAPRSLERGRDDSSEMIDVDHNQCIMCGRCVRGCNWVKENRVIGRSGKGYATVISFDLNQPMQESSCVGCGECAVSCPTGALEFNPMFLLSQADRVSKELKDERKDGEIVPPEELAKLPLFQGIPFKFLQFNASAVVRRLLKPGDILCKEGEHGATAFVINQGSFRIFISGTRGAVTTTKSSGLAGMLGGLTTVLKRLGGNAQLADVGAASLDDGQVLIRTADDVILGEMTCMNRYPRSATVVANEEAEVLEIRRNVLYMLQRNESSRRILENAYRERAMVGQLEKLPFLASLDETSRADAVRFLQSRVDLISVDPGQTIFEQGDFAEDFYIVKLGFVKVSQKYGQYDRVLNYLGPGNSFGEIGLLSSANRLAAQASPTDQVGRRTATCSALDHVELIRISGRDFDQMRREFPQLDAKLQATAQTLLERDRQSQSKLQAADSQGFLEQGLYLAQSLLVLDLERCTRCDECTKACADTHDGVTRLVRDGLRFDKYLVASSCRSCMDPYCLIGCPVDAIHRNGDSLEIKIEDYCIGCGLCAGNCPYGNINMHGFPKTEIDARTNRETKVFEMVEGKRLPVIQQRATTCDLCSSVDGKPSCVYACPHNAAFRMTGEELMKIVSGSN